MPLKKVIISRLLRKLSAFDGTGSFITVADDVSLLGDKVNTIKSVKTKL